jgi:hypothetical protein
VVNRRDFLKGAAITTAGTPFWMGGLAGNLWGKIPSDIKITEVRPIFVASTLYVKIFTNKGVTGLGASSLASMGLALEGAVKDLGRLLTINLRTLKPILSMV